MTKSRKFHAETNVTKGTKWNETYNQMGQQMEGRFVPYVYVLQDREHSWSQA